MITTVTGRTKSLAPFELADRDVSHSPFEKSFFTHPAFVASNHRVELTRVVEPPQRSTAGPCLFEIDGEVARHIGKLRRMKCSEISGISETLFCSHDVQHIVFEDIVLDDSISSYSTSFIVQHFRYQANWRRALAPGTQYLSRQRTKAIERKLRQLGTILGSKPTHVFRRTRSDDIDLIAEMSRRSIESRGARCRFSDLKNKQLTETCEHIGYSSMLVINERVISGLIICITGDRAYFMLTGFDAQFKKYSPGVYLMAKSLEACTDLGCTEANLLWGDSGYKSNVGAQRQSLDTIVVSRNCWQLFHLSGLGVIAPYIVQSAKRYTKSLLRR